MPEWKEMKETLKEGDVIRTPQKVGYAYAICTGSGFGCNPRSIGNAIYVIHEGTDLEEVLKHKDDDPENQNWSRWERYWGIEVMTQ